MFDMLQLVVMIPQTQALILTVTSYMSVGNLGDKLKHVGNLVVDDDSHADAAALA